MKKRVDQVQGEKILSRLRSVSLHQFTAPNPNFVGRKKETLEILTRHREGTRQFCIWGQPGIGKTTTALAVADKMVPYFPNFQVYFDLSTAESDSRAVSQAMAHVIQSLRPETKIPETEKEVERLYHAVLRGQRGIILTDNVLDETQLKKLTPRENCALISTASRRLNLPGMHSVELPTPPPEDSRDLLLALCPRIGFWTAEISASCGHNPMAVNMCARFLALNEEMDPADFSSRLRDENNRLQRGDKDRNQLGVESAISLVSSMLPEPALRTLWKMTVFPDSFEPQSESFICEDKEGKHLALLIALGLVYEEEDNVRLRMHPLVRDWCLQQAQEGALAQSQIRHATYYMTTLQQINQLYSQSDKNQVRQALSLFDLEWPNIRAGQDWARRQCLQREDAAKICYSYAELAQHLLRMRRFPAERLDWFEAALAAARSRQDEEAEMFSLLNMGREYLALKNFPKAIEHLSSAQALAQQGNNDLAVRSEILHGLGRAHIMQKDFLKGIEFFAQELDLGLQVGNQNIQVRAAEELAQAHLALDNLNEAQEFLEQGYQLARSLGDPVTETRLLLVLGTTQIKSKKTKKALENLRRGLSLAAKIKNKKQEAAFLTILADLHISLDECPQAVMYYEKAAQVYRLIKDSTGEIDSLGRQGMALIKSGNPAAGIGIIEKAIQTCLASNNVAGEITLLSYLGSALLDMGDIPKATETFDRQLELAKKTRSTPVKAKALYQLAQLEEKQGNTGKAATHYKAALDLFEKAKLPEADDARRALENLEKGTTKPVET